MSTDFISASYIDSLHDKYQTLEDKSNPLYQLIIKSSHYDMIGDDNFRSYTRFTEDTIMDPINAVTKYIQNLTITFTNSLVYDTHSHQNIHLDTLRKSLTTSLNYDSHQPLFKLLTQVVKEISNWTGSDYSLIPTNVDVIKYVEGDFFKKHTDFEPVKCKFFEYYALLICIDANCEGGETIVYTPYGNFTFTDTIRPNYWMLFKSSLEHESNVIKTGYKIVLKADVIKTNFNDNPEIHQSLSSLLDARNSIITSFKSKPHNVLPVYSLSEYLFYRD